MVEGADFELESVSMGTTERTLGSDSCEEWLEKEDAVVYARDFDIDPILVTGDEKEWMTCGVGCQFGFNFSKSPDARFGFPQQDGTASVLRSMESTSYYAENNIAQARRMGFNVVMTTKTLKRYKFSLAFENSNEEDYVIEKFFQSLVAGTIPVVIGAPNIQDFAPAHNSILHIKELEDVDSIAKTMKYLGENLHAYNQSLRWKYEGPSDSFKALVDMAAVHSSCRLCIQFATYDSRERRNWPRVQETPLQMHQRLRDCISFICMENLTPTALEAEVLKKFKSLKHVPIWKQERPERIRGDNLKVYRVYPVGMTQRQALYTFKFNTDDDFKNHLEVNPCAKFEVIFVKVISDFSQFHYDCPF
ncbi:hypothetical protein OIU77_021103 [Salix suchowensis]|uniref:Fucosyltransferase n=1 Tax=Salix suchowensis TaxID=1278906 RepID=A0ABQ9CBM2_9ROSI|nr:hypothetical protein OIU77_021103 [Salix suchowensis]